jgi:hypothetical protein
MNKRDMWLVILLILIISPSAFGASKPENVQNKLDRAIQAESKAQQKADEWNIDKDDLVNEIRELQTRHAWLQYQKGKHLDYVKRIKENIAALEAKKLEARQLRENLEPYLEDAVDRLDAFIKKDLPFLIGERQQRINFLHNTLNDYHLELGEKLRRVFEALSVEATYGKMVTASDETLKIEGIDTEVTIFRLGRLAMYYQSIDGEKIGIFNPEKRNWEPLGKEYDREIRRALEMARRERTVQLIQLPLGVVIQ